MKQKTAPLCILAAGTLWGVMGVFVRYFHRFGLGSMEICALRVFTGFLIIGLYLLLCHRELLRIRLKDLWCFLGSGICSLFFMNLTYFTAMQYTSLAVAGVLLYTAPIFVMLLSALLFREQITGKKLIALILAFSGCALVSGLGSGSHISAAGLLFGLGSGISYALYSIFGRFAIRRGYGSWTITFYSFLLCSIPALLFCNRSAAAALFLQPVQLIWILALGLITAFAPYVLYSLGLEAMETGRASILASAEPVVASLVSVLVFSEPMSPSTALGIALVISAIVLLSIQKK